MAEPSNSPSLLVLSGPKAGTRFILEDVVDNILIGSDPSCRFVLEGPGVSPIHARLWVDAAGATLYDTNSPAGLYINDNRVTQQAPVRNGDIIWLGTPGDPDAVMIQCAFPPRRSEGLGMDDATSTLAFKGPWPGLESPRPEPMVSDPDALDGTETVVEPLQDETPGEVPPEEESVEALDESVVVAAPPPEETVLEARPEEAAPDAEETVLQPPPEETVEEARPEEEEAPPEEAYIETEPEETVLEPPLEETVSEPPPEETVLEAAPDEAYIEAAPEETGIEEAGIEPLPSEMGIEAAPEDTVSERPAEEATMALPAQASGEFSPSPAPVEVEPEVVDMEAEPTLAMERPQDRALEDEGTETFVAASAAAWEPPPSEPIPPTPRPVFEKAPEPPPPVFEEEIEIEPTIADRPAATSTRAAFPDDQPTIALPPPGSDAKTTVLPKAPAPPPAPSPSWPPSPTVRPELPAPRPSVERAPATSTRPAPRPASTPSPVSPRPAAPRADRGSAVAPSAAVAVPPAAVREAKARPAGGMGLILGGVGVLALVAAAGLYFVFSRSDAQAPTPPTTVAAAPPPTSAITVPPVAAEPAASPAAASEAPAEPTPPPPVPVEEEVTIVRPPSPRAPAAPSPARPSPMVATTQRQPAPPPTAPAGPSAEVLRAQQVVSHVAQAQAAVASQNYDAAVAQYDEALKLDPQNVVALQGKTAAVAARAASRRKFVSGRTAVQTGKAKADLTGFESAGVSVQKAPDFQGRIEFEMSPPAVKAGENYTLKIYLLNEGKKSIKISGLTVATSLNGARSGGPVAPRVKEVAPQQRVLIDERPGVWPPEVATWNAEVLVDSGKGESLKNQLTWR